MKKYLILTFLGALSILMGKAQEQTPQTYQLTVGEMCMTIDAQKGARIMSLKYGDKEVISQTTWPETFGSTFWTSPQKEWNWPPVPEYDKLPYAVEERDGRIVMTSGVSERMKYRIEKTFATDERKQAFVVTYSIINESTEPRKVAPWEITRVPNNGGLIFFDAPVESITPAGLMDFRCVEGVAWYQPDVTQQNRKINRYAEAVAEKLALGVKLRITDAADSANMVKCPECGILNPPGSIYCLDCGADIQKQ